MLCKIGCSRGVAPWVHRPSNGDIFNCCLGKGQNRIWSRRNTFQTWRVHYVENECGALRNECGISIPRLSWTVRDCALSLYD